MPVFPNDVRGFRGFLNFDILAKELFMRFFTVSKRSMVPFFLLKRCEHTDWSLELVKKLLARLDLLQDLGVLFVYLLPLLLLNQHASLIEPFDD